MARFAGSILAGPVALLLLWCAAIPVWAQTVPEIRQTISVASFRGHGALAVTLSRDWTAPQPDIVRAVITIHGKDRDAAAYDRIARAALARAGDAGRGTLLVTPRFTGQDEPAADLLRWRGDGWMEGGLSESPAAIGSFEALDAILEKLSDRALFPALRSVVLVGHSAGGQLVQRYAELGHAPDRLAKAGIAVRSVIANPSSYGYFTADRPTASGGFAPFPLDECHRFDDWKYGMRDLPDYAAGATAASVEQAYVRRDVTYLLGALDTDPSLDALDKSCAAEAQGPNHLIRGHDFFRYLRLRHPDGLNQREDDIAGIGHDASGMLESDCALAAIYDAPLCGHAAPAPASPAPGPTATIPAVKPATRLAARPAPDRLRPRRAPVPIPRPRPAEHRPPPVAGRDWQPGGWDWTGGGYIWVPGHALVRRVPHPVFVPASWQFDGYGWVWVPAHWRSSR
jgi:hypothetical protein